MVCRRHCKGVSAHALILDFGGVISKTVFETHDLSEEALGLSPGTLTWRGPFDPTSDPLWQDMQAYKISEREYYRIRALETGKLVGEHWDTFPKFLSRIRGNDPQAVIRPEALDAIARVRAAGMKLAVLSNELDLFYGADFREKLPFLNDFDVITDATYTGILKPDPRAYQGCIEDLAIPVAHCVFVDDQQRNITGANAIGLPSVKFDVHNPAEGYRKALVMLGLR